jgi:ABC-type glycerol-3-phosphate transport system substrate-binding protein
MRSFHAVVLFIFVGMALFGVFIFATFSAGTREAIGTVEIWGALPRESVEKVLQHVRDQREDFSDVVYRPYTEDELVPAVVEAIAAGRGPDLVFFPGDAMVKDGDKLAPISFDVISRREFQDTFVEAGEVFLTPDGIAALPVVIDPMVMYWNRTLFANAAIPNPPRTWDDVAAVAPRLTERTQNGSVTIAAVPLGQWDNVAHAKGVLVTLIHQLGNPVVEQREDGTYTASLFDAKKDGVTPAVSAVRYYADFADPVKPMYSWNRSQKNSRDAFLAGTLAMYFAPASELLGLRAANPNLNYDVAPLPTARLGGKEVAADVVGVAIARGAPNPRGAYLVATVLASPEQQLVFATELELPSPRRDVEVSDTSDPYRTVFRASALRSFTFLDPDPPATNAIFSRMIENIASGRSALSDAVRDAHDELRELVGVR